MVAVLQLIGCCRAGTLKAKRDCARFVREKDAIDKVFGPFAERYKCEHTVHECAQWRCLAQPKGVRRYRPGGYTRVVRTRQRKSDNAPLAYVEFIDRCAHIACLAFVSRSLNMFALHRLFRCLCAVLARCASRVPWTLSPTRRSCSSARSTRRSSRTSECHPLLAGCGVGVVCTGKCTTSVLELDLTFIQ